MDTIVDVSWNKSSAPLPTTISLKLSKFSGIFVVPVILFSNDILAPNFNLKVYSRSSSLLFSIVKYNKPK